MTPTQRSIAGLKALGYTVGVVERFIPERKIRIDLYGCIDILAVRPGEILGVQACAGSGHAAHRVKALAEPRLKAWLEAGGRYVIWSWSKCGARGRRKLWTLREEALSLDHLSPTSAECSSLP